MVRNIVFDVLDFGTGLIRAKAESFKMYMLKSNLKN